jgi:hypothetical protein
MAKLCLKQNIIDCFLFQDMREKDANGAEDFKKKMTERFQKTVQALEEESQAEKRQLQVSLKIILI